METETFDNWLLNHSPIDDGRLLSDGEVVDGYEICGFLGKGGSGEVYRAKHKLLETPVAIKILHKDAPDSEERFKREAALLMSMSHKCFPKFYGYGKYKSHPYIVLEELQPWTLPSDDKAVADFLIKLCEGIGCLHAQGFIHRDIKPQNILFRADGTPVLIDLGLVKKTEILRKNLASTKSTISVVGGKVMAMGTLRYSAPEQFTGDEITFAADIHAIGMLIYACFNGETPKAWQPILRRATSSVAKERYSDVDAFVRAVKNRNASRYFPYAFAIATIGIVIAAWFVAAKMYTPDVKLEGAYRRWNSIATSAGKGITSVKLCGELVQLGSPISLKRNDTVIVEGPGCLDVDIRGNPSATVVLRHCALMNTTKDPDPKHSPRFILEDGSYLNFTELSNCNEADFADPYNVKTSAVRFGGPTFTLRGLQ